MVDHENSLYSRRSLYGLELAITLPWTTCMGCAKASFEAAPAVELSFQVLSCQRRSMMVYGLLQPAAGVSHCPGTPAAENNRSGMAASRLCG